MAKRPNQRLKLLYLAKIMLRLTDDEHGLQVEQIINELAKYDIAAERKSIYSDLEALQLFGIDIEKKHIGRFPSLPEAREACRFIPNPNPT